MSESAKMINFELVSPEERLVSDPVNMAIIPGEEGEFGVGAGHCALVAALKPGTVELYNEAGATPRKIFIAGGFADVTAENCTILAEEAVDVATLNQSEIEQKITDLNEDLSLAEEEIDKTRIIRALDLLKAKLSAITGRLVV